MSCQFLTVFNDQEIEWRHEVERQLLVEIDRFIQAYGFEVAVAGARDAVRRRTIEMYGSVEIPFRQNIH